MKRRIASLSLDLDNKWSYLKTHGDAGWGSFPSYLDLVVPRFLEVLERQQLKITVFVVGQDAALDKNRQALSSIAAAGHEIGNHSFRHEPWLHLYADDELSRELQRAEQAIVAATGQHPVGFRGPGFSCSPATLATLARRGYTYDGSTFPTFLGPAARLYYFFTARLDQAQKEERKRLFGRWRDGFQPLRPFVWQIKAPQPLVELPVTTFPWIKSPIHVSYLLYLSQYSPALAHSYFREALRWCRWSRVQPSLLLHPLDFLGGDDEPDLDFFPAMNMPGQQKVAFVEQILKSYTDRFHVVTMREHAQSVVSG